MKELTPEQKKKIDELIIQSGKECEEYEKAHPYKPNTLDGGQRRPYEIKFQEELMKIVNGET